MTYTDPDNELDLVAWETEERDAPFYGDPRRCPSHPHVKTSSPDGMFDGPCWECEAAMDEPPDNRSPAERADDERREAEALAAMAADAGKAEKARRNAFEISDDIPF